jgi:chorismate synthase
MGSVFGNCFRIATWGESHGGGIGVVIEGCPPLIPVSMDAIQQDLDRRRPGQSRITTQRKEADLASVVSGLWEGKTTGTPIAILVGNTDHRPGAYDEMKDKFRPSHADYTYLAKYGIRNHEGGGRSSARETIGRVAAGSVARQVLHALAGVEIRAYVSSIHTFDMIHPEGIPFPTLEQVEANDVRCPDPALAEQMVACIREARNEGDSVGGRITCRMRNLPPGLGAPVFDRFEADLAKAMLSIPATKAFEIGSGFAGARLRGSDHNDIPFRDVDGKVRTRTNRSGGVQGGITNGEEVYFHTAFKPTATILKSQPTLTVSGETTELAGKGRHDPCVVPRAVVVVEAMAALVALDHLLRHRAQCGYLND